MIQLSICVGSSCHIKGSYNVIQTFQQLIEENKLHDKIEMKAQFCMQRCQYGVAVSIGDEVFSVTPESAREFFQKNVAIK